MIDIEDYVTSKLSNHRYKVSPRGELSTTCPFHDDRGPSFSINLNSGKWICHSASCGLKGGFPTFYKLVEGITSWKEVKSRLRLDVPAKSFDDLFGFNSSESVLDDFAPTGLPKGLIKVSASQYPTWLVDRGYYFSDVEEFDLRVAISGPFKNHLFFPYYGWDNSLLSWSARSMGPKKRWHHPNGSVQGQILYGIDRLNQLDRLDHFFLVEGPFDVISLSIVGQYAVALSGSNISSRQLLDISKISDLLGANPVVLLDYDAADKAETVYYELKMVVPNTKIVYLQEDIDPGDIQTVEVFEKNVRVFL